MLSTVRIRQKMRVRVTVRQHLPPKEDALTATGRRDARGLNTTRITAWCFVSGVDASIGMSTETDLSKGAVQWSWRVSRNTKSRGSTKTQRQHNVPVLGHTALWWNSPYRPWNEARLSRWNTFSTLGFTLLKLSAISWFPCSAAAPRVEWFTSWQFWFWKWLRRLNVCLCVWLYTVCCQCSFV